MKTALILLILVLAQQVLAHDGVPEESVAEIPETLPAPSISINVIEDSVSDWNIHIVTANFTFDPPGAPSEAGHGHAHVYVDGAEDGLAYGEWYYLGELPQGCHDIEVHLTTNDHTNYAYGGKFVRDTKTACAETTDLAVHPEDIDTPGNQYIYLLVLIGGAILGYLFGLKNK